MILPFMTLLTTFLPFGDLKAEVVRDMLLRSNPLPDVGFVGVCAFGIVDVDCGGGGNCGYVIGSAEG